MRGRPDFREVDNGDHVVFVYFLGQGEDVFPDPDDQNDPAERRKALVTRPHVHQH